MQFDLESVSWGITHRLRVSILDFDDLEKEKVSAIKPDNYGAVYEDNAIVYEPCLFTFYTRHKHKYNISLKRDRDIVYPYRDVGPIDYQLYMYEKDGFSLFYILPFCVYVDSKNYIFDIGIPEVVRIVRNDYL